MSFGAISGQDLAPPGGRGLQRSEQPVADEHELVRLDQFLKLCGIAGTGGQAKLLIQGGEVMVNGELETRRRRKLASGDVVQLDGIDYSFDEFVSKQ